MVLRMNKRDLYEEARDHFEVTASMAAHPIQDWLSDRVWPTGNPPVSMAWLCGVVLTAAFAMKKDRLEDLKAWLATKGLPDRAGW